MDICQPVTLFNSNAVCVCGAAAGSPLHTHADLTANTSGRLVAGLCPMSNYFLVCELVDVQPPSHYCCGGPWPRRWEIRVPVCTVYPGSCGLELPAVSRERLFSLITLRALTRHVPPWAGQWATPQRLRRRRRSTLDVRALTSVVSP